MSPTADCTDEHAYISVRHEPRAHGRWTHSPRVPSSSGGGGGRLYVRVADLEEAGLDEEVPDAARLVHVDLDEVARLASAQLAAAARVLADERLLDDKVRLREDAELRTEGLLLGR